MKTIEIDGDDMPDFLKKLLQRKEPKFGPSKPLSSVALEAVRKHVEERTPMMERAKALMTELQSIERVMQAKKTLLWELIHKEHPETATVNARYDPDKGVYQVETAEEGGPEQPDWAKEMLEQFQKEIAEGKATIN